MRLEAESLPARIEACDCLTPLGNAAATHAALLAGRRALVLQPVLGGAGGDTAPLALCRPMEETLPPRWLPELRRLAGGIPGDHWGSARRPVIVTSSNFGVGSLYAFTRDHDERHLRHGPPFACVDLLRREFGWGDQVWLISHACVSAQLGLAHGARLLHARLAERVLVFTFDFVSPFVAGGFYSLKILNASWPAPYAVRESGSIGLGDGAAFAVLGREHGDFLLAAHALHNEMHHFTGNRADGSGFAACADALAGAAAGRRVWIKGHGTGTLEAGRLEAEAFARALPGAPLVSWKGSLGHTLGSCGLVELALALAAVRTGRVPGTVGSTAPCFADNVAVEPFDAGGYDGVILDSNAFGGAHAAMLLTHA